jgi:hypothetical protein
VARQPSRQQEKEIMENRTIWIVGIVVVVLALLACCCIGVVLASGVHRYGIAEMRSQNQRMPDLPDIMRVPAVPESGTVRGSGVMVEREYAVGNIDGVRLALSANLTIRLGSQPSLYVRAEDNIIELIQLDEDDDTLSISMRHGISVTGHDEIELVLTVPHLSAITHMATGSIVAPGMTGEDVAIRVSGSGDVTVEGIEGESVNINSLGSGDITAQGIVADRLKVNISGSGAVSLGEGKVSHQEVTIMGSGNHEASEVVSARVVAQMSGSGDARVQAVEELVAELFGSGNLEYVGEPTVVNANVSGSGEVRQLRP